jgi:hypothetical protein
MRHLVQNICKLRSRVSPQTTGDRAAAKGGWAGRLEGSGRSAWGWLNLFALPPFLVPSLCFTQMLQKFRMYPHDWVVVKE